MAQGCWSVVPVCATSYSWKTGPHWGSMESPQTAAGTRDPATPSTAATESQAPRADTPCWKPGEPKLGVITHLDASYGYVGGHP